MSKNKEEKPTVEEVEFSETTKPDTENTQEVEELSDKDKRKLENSLILSGKDFDDLNIYERMVVAYNARTLPTWVKEPSQAVIIVAAAAELGIKPLMAFRYLYLVNNTPTLQSNCMSDMVRSKKGKYRVLRDMDIVYQTNNPKNVFLEGELILNKEGNPIFMGFATTLEARRPDDDQVHIVNYTLGDAVRAGLISEDLKTGKDNWVKNPKAMMMARCISKMSRLVFPDFIGGFYTPEELNPDGTVILDADGNVIMTEPE